jgi:hypothetical protein
MDYLRRLPFRAIALPLSVAIVSVAGLAWFDRVWVPAQKQYLSERNLRILRALSTQMKSRIDNFDSAIDHAIDSMPYHKASRFDLGQLREYVKLFAQNLEVLVEEDTEKIQKTLKPSDPPRVTVRRDEGRNYLYLAYSHARTRVDDNRVVTVVARADIGQVAATYLTPREEFDALLVVDRHGETIAQRSTSGLDLARIRGVLDSAPGPAADSADKDKQAEKEKPSKFDRSWGTTNLAIVTVGPTDYVLFAQPMQLSLLSNDPPDGSKPEEWALCGLVELNRFRAASSTIRTTYWLWIGFALVAFCLSVPLLKLRLLKPSERLRRFDAVLAVSAVFLLAALTTFFALDLYYFGVTFARATDTELRAVAETISQHVQDETSAIYGEMSQLEDRLAWRQLNYLENDSAGHGPLEILRERLKAKKGTDIFLQDQRPKCHPESSCRDSVLATILSPDWPFTDNPYPYFKLATWDDESGWQRIKWSTSKGVTPFVNANEARFSYFEALKRARRLHALGSADRRWGVTVLRSPNTGEELTVFWKALLPRDPAGIKAPNESNRQARSVDLIGQTLALSPLSLTDPVLPRGIQFAVISPKGRVLYHSDPVKSLGENFFRESEDNAELRSIVAGHGEGWLTASYFGGRHRLFVRPLVFQKSPESEATSSESGAFENPEWSLVVFQAGSLSESINLGTVALAVVLFGFYALMMGAAWSLLYWCWPAQVTKWFWPDRRSPWRYRAVAALNAAVGVAGIGAVWSLESFSSLATVMVLAVVATMATFAIVRRARTTDGVSSTWPSEFFWARTVLLFVSAIVPAVACYHVAYLYETGLGIRSGRAHLAHELRARENRTEDDSRNIALCGSADSGAKSCHRVAEFVERRQQEMWDVHVPGAVRPLFASTFEKIRQQTLFEQVLTALTISTPPPSRLGASTEQVPLKPVIQVDPAAPAITIAPPALARLDGPLGLILFALAGGAYLLARYSLKPLFVMDVETREALRPISHPNDGTSNELLVGPSGSGKSDRLRQDRRVRVFDVRALAFANAPSSVPQPAAVGAGSSTVFPTESGPVNPVTWVGALQLQLMDPTLILGIDHLEYRFSDQAFRAQMLECLETAIYRAKCPVRITSTRDPLEQLDDLKNVQPDLERWARALESFHKETVGLAPDPARAEALGSLLDTTPKNLTHDLKASILSECAVAPQLLTIGEEIVSRLPASGPLSSDAILDEIGDAADHFYRALWNGCSRDEQLALRQLAEEGLINPNNQPILSRLLRARLVSRHDSIVRVMNESFRRFVRGAAPARRITVWEHHGVALPWGSIAAACLTVALGLGGLLLLTQQQLVDAWVNYVPALAPAIPSMWKLLAGGPRGVKGALA